MTIPKFDQLTGNESLPQLTEMVAKLQKQVQWLMDGKLGDDNIRANSITAVKLDVEELSAITADMGKLTSGEIYGAYIATREASFPRAEMNEIDNLFAAMASANQYLNVGSSGGGSVPYIEFRDLTAGLLALINLGSFFKIESQRRMDIQSTADDIFISANNIRLQNTTRIFFSNLIDNLLGTSLDTQLSAKANGSGINGTVYVATTSGGSPTTAITFNNGVRQS